MPRKTNHEFSDPVLGKVAYVSADEQWRAQVAAGAGRKIALVFPEYDGPERPRPAMLALARKLTGRSNGVGPAIEAALWAFYNDVVVKNYRAYMEPADAALLTPHLERSRDVWKLVRHVAIRVTQESKGRVKAELVGSCQWDDEHGFEMDFSTGKYVAAT